MKDTSSGAKNTDQGTEEGMFVLCLSYSVDFSLSGVKGSCWKVLTKKPEDSGELRMPG